jgi:hypothetical protein
VPSLAARKAAAEAKQLGTACYRKRDYACAVRHFEAALRIQGTPELRFNLGAALDKLGLTARAYRNYSRYIKTVGVAAPPKIVAYIQKRVEVLKGKLALVGVTLPDATKIVGRMVLLVDRRRIDLQMAKTGQSRIQLVLQPGLHTVRLTVPNCEPLTAQWSLTAGQVEKTLRPTCLTPEKTGKLSIESLPTGAHVYLDGRLQPARTPCTLFGLAPGAHQLFVATPLLAIRRRVTIIRAQTTRVQLQLQQLSARVVVRSKPAGARLSFNGTALGVTPLTVTKVRAGVHKLTFTHKGYRSITIPLAVSALEKPVYQIERSLQREVPPLDTLGDLPPVLPFGFSDRPLATAHDRRDQSLRFDFSSGDTLAFTLSLDAHLMLTSRWRVGISLPLLLGGYFWIDDTLQKKVAFGDVRLLSSLALAQWGGRVGRPKWRLAAWLDAALPTHSVSTPREFGLIWAAVASFHQGLLSASLSFGGMWRSAEQGNHTFAFNWDGYAAVHLHQYVSLQLGLQGTSYFEPRMDQPAIAMTFGARAHVTKTWSIGLAVRPGLNDVGRLLFSRASSLSTLITVNRHAVFARTQ